MHGPDGSPVIRWQDYLPAVECDVCHEPVPSTTPYRCNEKPVHYVCLQRRERGRRFKEGWYSPSRQSRDLSSDARSGIVVPALSQRGVPVRSGATRGTGLPARPILEQSTQRPSDVVPDRELAGRSDQGVLFTGSGDGVGAVRGGSEDTLPSRPKRTRRTR